MTSDLTAVELRAVQREAELRLAYQAEVEQRLDLLHEQYATLEASYLSLETYAKSLEVHRAGVEAELAAAREALQQNQLQLEQERAAGAAERSHREALEQRAVLRVADAVARRTGAWRPLAAVIHRITAPRR